jgi:cell division protein FtsB
MIPVEGYKNLYRDEKTGAIINCDSQGYANYISQKKEREKLKSEVKDLKSELNEIKLLLKEVLNGQQKN